ncbi:MAG TPA: rod shape-determining protein RodA [Patescibacteria group bacterium]|nr:rod shape-determining protein RodA [Patescibacteria group bacterium]
MIQGWIGALRRTDGVLTLAVAVLLMLGFAALYSVSLSSGSSQLLFKQGLAVTGGGLAAAALAISNYRLLRGASFLLYGVTIATLAGVLIIGTSVRGTTGWFSLFGFHLQPVEFAKVSLIILLARYLGQRGDRPFRWKDWLITGGITALPVLLTFLQPDTGSALLLLAVWGGMMTAAGASKRQLFFLVCLMAVVGSLAWQTVLADYQKQRVLVFLHPSADPSGEGYNVHQAMIAIGSGGWFGRGLGFGPQSQLRFLPERQTDFIFAVLAEELGLVGTLLVLVALAALVLRSFHQAALARDPFAGNLLSGLAFLFLFQSSVNVGMNFGLLPVTGVPLPFVSYGGSSLVSALLAVGIIQSVAARNTDHRRLFQRTDSWYRGN